MLSIQLYKKCVTSHYLTFYGRARRSEFWYFVLITLCITFAIIFIGAFIEFITGINEVDTITKASNKDITEWIAYGFLFLSIIPFLSVAVRRMKDSGSSPWLLFLWFLPYIGVFSLMFFLCKDSENGPNAHGDNPKGIGNHSYEEIPVEDLI